MVTVVLTSIVIFHVPAEPRFNGPSLPRLQLVIPETAGLTLKLLTLKDVP
jgi:hypothetical protein